MAEIATAAGITKPVLYDHFPSKRALFVSLSEAIRDEMLARGAAAIAGTADAEARFRAGIEAFFAFVAERPDAARVMFVVPRGAADLTEPAAAIQKGATDRLTLMLAAILPSSALALPEAATECLKQGLHAMAEWWAEHPEVSRDALVETAMTLAWRGLAASVQGDAGTGSPATSAPRR